jgi:hypothetical protein
MRLAPVRRPPVRSDPMGDAWRDHRVQDPPATGRIGRGDRIVGRSPGAANPKKGFQA